MTARIDPAWPARALDRLQGAAATFAHLLAHRASRRQLRRLDARLQALARNSCDTILLVDSGSTVHYATESAERVLGVAAQELVGRRFMDLLDPADRESAVAHFRAAIARGSSTTGPLTLRLAGAQGRHVEVVATDARDDEAVVGVVLNVRDVDDRVRAESEAQRIGNALNAATLAVAFAGPDRRVTHVNRALLDLFAHADTDTVVGADITALGADPDDARRLVEELRYAGSWTGEIGIARADGARRVAQVTVSATSVPTGPPSGFIASFVDVTERRRVEQALQVSEAQLAHIIETAPVVIFAVDTAGHLTMLKGRELRMVRAGRDDVLAQSLFERFAGLRETSYLRRALDGEASSGEIRTLGRVFQVSITPMRGADGNVTGAVGVALDTTERAAAEQAYRDSQKRFQVLVEQVSDAIVAFNRQGVVSYASPAALDMFGPHVAPGGRSADLWSIVAPSDVAILQAAVAAVASEPGCTRTVRFGLRRDGEQRHVIEARLKNLLDDPVIEAVVVYSSEVTEREHYEHQLARLALHDALTGLPNRALLADRIEQALARHGDGGGTVAVLFLDVDHFKIVNDSLGHAAGDELLRIVSERLARAARNVDTVARFGGDEFVVLVDLPLPRESAASQVKLLEIGRRMCRSIAPPVVIAGRSLAITASIGIACAHDEATAETLIRDADAAMYLAKRRGRNQVATFDAELRSQVQDRLELEIGLRRALHDDLVVWHYQPIVSLASGAVVGFESLMRWVDAERGPIPPSDFIPVAEDSELIEKLGIRALERACSQLVTLECRSAWEHGPYVAVNTASRQLTRDFPDQVRRLLKQSSAPPDRLVIELTEGTLMQDSGATREALQELRELGVRIAVDDFGTGYSSLAYLEAFPVDIVKIDRSFVAAIGTSRRRLSLVQAIISMAHALDIRVVAEGVETAGQLDVLRQLGCDAGQGFYFSPAVHDLHLLPSVYRL
jgi:diguanylate cyclase (GGDEF)-like protein/PAS domain S-box-containing protein